MILDYIKLYFDIIAYCMKHQKETCMGRGGINKTLVIKARQNLIARGGNPSIDAVWVELGNTSSKSTIHRYLKEIEETETSSTKKHYYANLLESLLVAWLHS